MCSTLRFENVWCRIKQIRYPLEVVGSSSETQLQVGWFNQDNLAEQMLS